MMEEVRGPLLEMFTDDPVNWVKWAVVFTVLVVGYVLAFKIYSKIEYHLSVQKKADLARAKGHVIENAELINVRKKGTYQERKEKHKTNYSATYRYTLDGKEYISDQNCVILHPKNRSYSLYGNIDGHFNVIDFDTYSPLCDTFKIIPINDISSYLEDFEKIRGLSLFKENKPLIFSTFYKIIDRLIKDSKPKNDILYPAINYLKNKNKIQKLLVRENYKLGLEIEVRKFVHIIILKDELQIIELV